MSFYHTSRFASGVYCMTGMSCVCISGLGIEKTQGTPGHAMWIAEAGCADDATWTDNPSGGYLYEHSTYMDIVLQVVVGLIPRAVRLLSSSADFCIGVFLWPCHCYDCMAWVFLMETMCCRTQAGPNPTLRVQPLLPSDTTLSYFALDAAMVGGRLVSVIWDAGLTQRFPFCSWVLQYVLIFEVWCMVPIYTVRI